MSKNFELLRSVSDREVSKSIPIIGATSGGVRAALTRPFDVQPSHGEAQEWWHALRAIHRQWRWSMGFAVVFSLCVTAALFLIKPVYEPTAKIEVDPPGNELFSLDPRSPGSSIAYAETQAQNLQTDQLAVAVIRNLHLDRNPEFTREAEATPTDANGGHQLDFTPAERSALKVFQRGLKVQRDPSSWLINVSYAAHDPKLAALVANTVVDKFIEMNLRTRHDMIVESTQWLSQQLDDIRAQMDQSDRALAEFQKSTGITPVGKAQSTFDEKMSELNRQVTVAQADRIQLEALLQKVNAENAETLPQINANVVIQELSKKIAGARADLKTGLIVYGRNHPKTKELQAQINELEVQLKAQQGNLFSNLQTGYAAARTRERLLNSELKNASKELGQMAKYEALRKEAEASEALYNTLYTKVKEAGITAGSKSSNVRWVDGAPILDAPTRPRRLLGIGLGILAGIVGGIMLAFVREGLDRNIHTLNDVQNLIAPPSVSLVPLVGTGVVKGVLQGNSSWKAGLNGNTYASRVFFLDRPRSPEAEALRGLATSVRLSRPSRPPQVLLIASSMASEGKTTIASNLSVALARNGSTCLVDADLRKPRVADVFGVGSEYGLSNVLDGSCPLQGALVPAPGVPNLWLLPAAEKETAGELICSDSLGEVLRQLRQQFQFIVVDSAPILPYADVRSISPMADGVILVARSGLTSREAIKRSLELLEQACSAPLLDVVVNGVDLSSWEYQYDYGAAYK